MDRPWRRGLLLPAHGQPPADVRRQSDAGAHQRRRPGSTGRGGSYEERCGEGGVRRRRARGDVRTPRGPAAGAAGPGTGPRRRRRTRRGAGAGAGRTRPVSGAVSRPLSPQRRRVRSDVPAGEELGAVGPRRSARRGKPDHRSQAAAGGGPREAGRQRLARAQSADRERGRQSPAVRAHDEPRLHHGHLSRVVPRLRA